jgi:hypothetical protein
LNKQTLAVIAGAIVLLVVAIVGAIAFTGGSESDPSGPGMTMPDGSTMPSGQMTTGMTMTNGETMP